MLKRLTAVFVLVALVIAPVSCAKAENRDSGIGAIKSYREIPGITDEEISKIETLRESRGSFSYGQMEETEAFVLSDGSYSGFAAGFCELLSDLFGMEFILETHDWETLIGGINDMSIDFTGDLTMTQERMNVYFMTHTIAERTLRVYACDSSDEIMTEKDMQGLRVGSLSGSIDIIHVREYYPDLYFSVVEVDSFDDAAIKLKRGDIDVFITEGVIDPLFDKYDYIISKEMFPMVYTPVSMTTANPELEAVISVVNRYLVSGGIDLLFDLYKKGDMDYSRHKLEKSFTGEELEYIKEHSRQDAAVKVALEQDNYPVSFYNWSEKEYQGIAVDALAEISALTGMNFEVVNKTDASWTEILEMLRSGEASMVSQLLRSEERKNSFLWSDRPYASAYYALLSKSDYPSLASYQVVRARVGLIKDSAYEDKYFEWFSGEGTSNIVYFNDQDNMLDALEKGEIDLLMGSDYLLLMQQNYREKPGFKLNIRFGIQMDSSFGFNIDEAVLCSVINKTMHYINTVVMSDEWTNRGYDYNKQMAQQNVTLLIVTTSALCIVLLLTIYYLIRNRKLNQSLDRKVAEMTVDLSNNIARIKAVISNYAGVIWSVDNNNVITLFDGLYLEEIGVTPDYLEGKNLNIARAKNRHLDIIEKVDQTISEGSQDWISEIDGKAFHAKTTPIHDEYGNITGVVGSVDDITETIRMQQQLEAALEKAENAVNALESAQLTLAAMFESNPQINILFDSEFKVIDCNPAAYMFIGLDSEEEFLAEFIGLVTAGIPEYQSDGRKSVSLIDKLKETVEEGVVKFDTELIVNSNCKILDVEFKKIPYDGSFAIVAYVFDVTEIREREMELIQRGEQLVAAMEEAKAANQAKSLFLSNMSHEIRTPMNAILGITEIQLQNEKLDVGIREALEKIYNSGNLLLGIINDLLDMSKIEAGKLELLITEYDIASLINDTAQINMMRIASKPIEFKVEADENIPLRFSGDELRIKQILNNLLSNAIKYTAEGTVKLRVACEQKEGENATLVFTVSDTGQGMTPGQIDKLFEEYTRFNLDINRTTEGTGLGMKITQTLVWLMNGEMTVKSEPGEGSLFTVKLPQRVNGSEVLGKEMADSLREFRIDSKSNSHTQIIRELMPYGSVLIVDDVETNIYVARGLLIPYELKIDSAESGFEAIDKIKQGKEYDIIFMDHMMPKMDGIETVKIMREMGYAKPIVALTANAVVGQAEMFIKNGFDDFISKPIDLRQLNAVLNKLVRDKQLPGILKPTGDLTPEKQAEPVAAAPGISQRFAEIFSRDAKKAIEQLEILNKKEGDFTEDEMKTYIINVHGMKSALANIGQMKISDMALELEIAGRENNTDKIASDTQRFIDSLSALVEELTLKNKSNKNESVSQADERYLRERLAAVRASCKVFDRRGVKDVLTELGEKNWPEKIDTLLSTVNRKLLHSDFDEIITEVNSYLRLT